MRYPVTITSDDNDTFLVTFPDVPGAITCGDTKEEALARAPEALLTVFDAYIKDRRDIPEPSAPRGADVEVPALETAKICLYREMRAANIGKAELAKRLDWHMPQVDRVIDVHHASRLDQMEAALAAVGKRLELNVVSVLPSRRVMKAGEHSMGRGHRRRSASSARPAASVQRPQARVAGSRQIGPTSGEEALNTALQRRSGRCRDDGAWVVPACCSSCSAAAIAGSPGMSTPRRISIASFTSGGAPAESLLIRRFPGPRPVTQPGRAVPLRRRAGSLGGRIAGNGKEGWRCCLTLS